MHNWCLSVYVYGKVLAVHKITPLLFDDRDVSHIEQTAELCGQRFSDSNELVHLLDKLGVLRESRDPMPYVTIGIGVLFPECNEDVKYSHRQQPRTYLVLARTNPASEPMQARRTIRASSGRGTGRQASDNPANPCKRNKVGRACYELRRPAGYPS